MTLIFKEKQDHSYIPSFSFCPRSTVSKKQGSDSALLFLGKKKSCGGSPRVCEVSSATPGWRRDTCTGEVEESVANHSRF